MVSIAGANLIATVYPVAILLVLVESRTIPRVKVRSKRRAILQLFGGLTIGASVLLGTLSVLYCVTAVSSHVPIHGGGAAVVFWAGALLFAAAGRVLYRLASEAADRWTFMRSAGTDGTQSDHRADDEPNWA